MTNNKGFIKFEVLTIFVLVIGVVAGGLYFILGSTNKQKYDTFKDNAISFGKTVSTNNNSFHNLENVYLDEVLDENLLKNNIKNPFAAGYCDGGESKVVLKNGKSYVTLKCGEYLIDDTNMNDKDNISIYTVTEWTDKELTGDNVESKTLYNCVDANGKELFDKYLEELYMVYRINKEFDNSYYSSSEISDCNVISKEMYREKKLFNESN